MAGIYSQGGSAGHRYAGWLETVEAKNFTFGGKVFNGSPSAIYVGSNQVWPWLTIAAQQAIRGAFGQRDGMAVIKATNAYLNQLAASDRDKATALAALINEDPMMVCSLGLEVEGVTMPIRWMKSTGAQYIDTGFNGFVHKQDTLEVHCQGISYPSSIAPIFGWRDASTPANLLELWVRNNSDYNTSTGTDFASGINSLTDVVFKFDKLKVYFNGTLNATATKELTATNTILLFVGRSGGGLDSRVTSSRIAYCKIWDNDVEAREMYPFIRNGVFGMIDVINETFHQNLGSGVFTEEYRLPDGTPWTPLNQQ